MLYYAMLIIIFTLACVYLFMCRRVCVYVMEACVHIRGGQKPVSDVIPQVLSILFFRQVLLSGPEVDRLGWARWPVSPKNLPVSTSPVLGL